MDNENEKRRLVGYHIWRKLSGMTDDELQSFSREIKDGADQHYTVWEMIEDAEHDARRDMIRDLTKRMVELSDIEPKDWAFFLNASRKFQLHGRTDMTRT
jgi:hypothetical protein